jgi:hypothetical protein
MLEAMQPPPYDPMQPPQFQPPPFNHGAPPGPAQPRGWLSRHTGLVVGIGCLGLLSAVCLFIVAIIGVVGTAMRASDPYKIAVSAAARDPAVIAELGTPVEPGWFTSGEINVAGSTGHASLAIPISGPRGSGTIGVVADKAAGKWTFSTLSVAVQGRAAAIDLRPSLPALPPP